MTLRSLPSHLVISWVLVAFLILAPAAAAAAPAANDIRIGGNFELSGRYIYYGDMAAKGAKLAFKEINDAGGIMGRKIDFVILDNASEKAKSAVVMKSLAGGKVAAVLGCCITANTLAAGPAAQEYGIPLISPSPGNSFAATGDGRFNPYLFRTSPADIAQGTAMASFAAEELGARTAALITTKSELSRDTAAAFEQAFVGAGGKIVAKETFTVTDNDYDTQNGAGGFKIADADVVFLSLGTTDAGQAIRLLREGGARMPLLGPNSFESSRLVAYVGEEYLNGVYFFAHYARSPKLTKIERFREAFIKEYSYQPSIEAAMGYDAALVLIAAIRKAGSADPGSIRSALEGIEVDGLTGPIRIDADHNVQKPAIVRKIIDGQPMAYRMFTP